MTKINKNRQISIFIDRSINIYSNPHFVYFYSGHQEVLRGEGKCQKFDPVPLVLVKDIMNYMPQMKYMFANVASAGQSGNPASDPAAKRMKLS